MVLLVGVTHVLFGFHFELRSDSMRNRRRSASAKVTEVNTMAAMRQWYTPISPVSHSRQLAKHLREYSSTPEISLALYTSHSIFTLHSKVTSQDPKKITLVDPRFFTPLVRSLELMWMLGVT
jgi:hypothetical protein